MSSYLAEPVPRDAERTGEDWRRLLLSRLDAQEELADFYDDFYDGRHPLQFATSKFREAFGNLFGAFADNWCQIVVDSAVERLRIVGFQVGGEQSEDAWAIWQRNGLDVESVIAHTEAGKCGVCFLLVDPNDGEPRITVEHAAQAVVLTDPADRRKRVAALKRWKGDDEFVYLTMYLPDAVFRFESADVVRAGSRIEWVPRRDAEMMIENPLGVVPMIPLANKPTLLPQARLNAGRSFALGHSDLEPAVPIQNAVNKLCSDMIIASEYGAFPQRALTGVDPPKDPETKMEMFKASLSRLWVFKPADARLWDLKTADLSNFVNAVEMFIQHLAAQTRTPPHYLLAKLVNASGDALQVAEAGLVSKCKAKTLFFSDAWEEAIALALSASGTETTAADCEAVWANPERVAQGALVDAAVKKQTLGVPQPVIWLELGYTPEQITEMEAAEPPPAPPEAMTPSEQGQMPMPPAPPPTGGTNG